MTDKQKKQIDSMDYESMLRLWRNGPVGIDLFIGDAGDYYAKVMEQKRTKLSHDERVEISKRIGQ